LPKVPNVKVDECCAETREVFEYFGCFWHGCRCTHNIHKPIGKTEETLLSRYEETQERLQKIENADHKVISMWGCEFRKHLRDNPGLKNEPISQPYVKNSHIYIRDVLYGGRIEARKSCYKVKQG
jgi:G:T-mismatch repair DNA endonuclease (very short patch repair protein)